jgi:type VI secretion system secreted protein VgrG
MPLYTQTGRLISLTTPLGDDKLLLTGLTGREAISRLFNFHLTTLSEDTAIDFTTIVGQGVTINVIQSDDSPRYFNGIVSQFSCTGKEGDMTRYELQVVPKLWTLTRYADCRIFHNKSVADIIKQVLGDRDITFQDSLTATYKPLEYCVQYRETDFNFISRLMEQFGIFYFFQHEDSDHTLVLADSSSVHQPCPGQSNAGFNLAAGGLDAGDAVNSWTIGQELRSGKYSLGDYNFTTSSSDLSASESTIYSVAGNDSMEIYDYPGLHLTQSDGTAMAKLRMEEEEAVHQFVHGAGVCRAFTTGYLFDLQDHPLDAMNASYLLTEIQHEASVAGTFRDDSASGGETESGKDTYSNHFNCIPADVVFRPARLTPKPFVQGPHTAVVVGKSADQDSSDDQGAGGDGEEIWVDKWGRVLVLFFWDRKKATSCWVRVSQDWAGKGWGMINIPRVGQEVIVSFLEGDPDRPIITGRVYNDVQTVPYALPDFGTRSTFRTSSSTGGGVEHYNELRFEDKTGKEQVFLRAEFDQDNYVKNDSREWIGNNRSLVVTKDQMDSIGGDYHEEITGKNISKIGGDRNEQVAGNEIIKISGDANRNVGGNLNEKIGSTLSLQVGQNLYEKSGMNYAHQAGQAIHLKAGMTVVIEAGLKLTLKAGSNFIDIGPAGIAISGTPMVMINSGGSAGSGCGSSPVSPTDPVDPKDPDLADDGKSGTKRGSGSDTSAASAGSAGAAASSAASAPSAPSASPSVPSLPAASLPAAAAGVTAVADQAQQTAQQATQQAAQVANQAAQTAQEAANQAQQAANQAEQEAQQAVQQVQQQASQAANQAQQAVNSAAAQAKAQAQQAAQQAQQQAAQAVQQAQQEAQKVQQQAQQAAQQAQQAAKQAQQQAQQAAQQAQQQAQQAAQQAQQAAKQGQQQAQQAAQQAQQQAQQAKQAAQQAAQQAQQASQQAQQAAQQAQQQAQQASKQVQQAASQSVQQAQQSAQQAQQAAQQGANQAGHGI